MGVAGGANQDLGLALKGLDDGFDQGGGLSGSRRAVDDGYFTAFHSLLDSRLLAAVEPREGEWGEV